ncbi:hypothetical protein HMPREF2858_04100 [Neisseria sp. HMSC073B07]|nr:hypothetical protein HMPREF2858_04100 [Neisseria sp. HMSC073B07]
MKVLVYKRTHTGDPSENGVFGESDCMGAIRNWHYDAVIGIGSIHPWEGDEGISGKVTWIGINPIRIGKNGRGDILKFKQFVLLEEGGPDFRKLAPNLANRFYIRNARFTLSSYSDVEKKEVERVIKNIIDTYNINSETQFVLTRRKSKSKNCTSYECTNHKFNKPSSCKSSC